ncbi:MAG: sensor domain-containing protein [Solirubrobacterales bacterium]
MAPSPVASSRDALELDRLRALTDTLTAKVSEHERRLDEDADPVQRLFALSMDMLGTATTDGYFTRLNPAWSRTLGWSLEELMAEPFLSFVHPDDVEATLQVAARIRAPGDSAGIAFENRYRTRDGDYRLIDWTGVAEHGVMYFVAKDVTDRRASDIEQDQAASLARAITDSVADGLLVADREGAIVYVNPSGLAMLGYRAGELVGHDCRATLHHGETDGGSLQRKDGSTLPVVCSSSPVPLASGTGRVVTFRDISAQQAASTARHEAEAGARRSDELHRILTANLPDTTVFLLDHDLRILIADGAAIRRLPWFDEDLFRGRLVAELDAMVPADVLALSLATYRAALHGERGGFDFLSEGLTFSVQAVPVRDDDDAVESVLVVARDITERTHAEQQIARHARQQKAVADLSRFALETHDLGALMAEAVTTATTTLGVDVGGVLELDEAGLSVTVVAGVGVPDGVVGAHQMPLDDSANCGYTLRTGDPTIVEDMATETRFEPSPIILKLGIVSSLSVAIEGHDRPFGTLDVHARERRAFSEDDVAFLSAIATLISVAVERHRGEEAARHAGLHDPLTDLPNRTLALDRLAHAVKRRRREGIDVAVLVLDVDRFGLVNDVSGHAAGDDVLLALAARLTAVVRATDTVARLSGDEFIVICPDVDGARGAMEVAERLATAVTGRLVLDSGEHSFTISTGIALTSTRQHTPESLLGDADAAMYRAKARGRGRYELFDEAMRTQAAARVRTETELRAALDRGELKAWYQPVIDLATGRPVSTEALVRWEHPERGLVPPLEFIPIAEEAGLIAELGLQVLEQACRQTASWQRDIDPELGVSVNISGRQAIDPDFPARVAAIAERSGLRAGTLALEITESVLMEEADSPVTVLGSLQEHGLTLVLDDFGTGYSSLSRLKRFPLDVLKIDRSFVSGIVSNADDRAIVKATIDMAHAVGLTVVAEGVETREQQEQLRAFGCDRAQGYLYARPQPPHAVTDLLAARATVSQSTGVIHSGREPRG